MRLFVNNCFIFINIRIWLVWNYIFSNTWIVWVLIFPILIFFMSIFSTPLFGNNLFWTAPASILLFPGVCSAGQPPLVGPNPLQVERIVAPPCSRPCSRANHLQPAKQKLCLGPESHHGQSPPQEGGGYCQLSLLCPHLPPPPLLGASHPHPRDGKVFGGGLYQFWQWQRVAGRRCPCPAVSNICICFEPL